MIERKAGQPATALEHFRKAVALDPNDARSHAHIGAILEEHGIPFQITEDPRQAPGWLGKAESCLVWAEFPPLSPPWNLPKDLLSSYCEEADDTPWPDPAVGPLDYPDDLLRLQNTYAAVVTHWDAGLGELLDKLRDRNVFDDTLLVLTGSGFPLGEHGYLGFHRPWLYEEAVHLPLLMRLPGAAEAGLRLPALTQPVDLFPTLLAGLNVPAPDCHGHDLWPLLRGEVDQVRPYACSGLQIEDRIAWSLRSLDWALLLPVATAPNDAFQAPQLFVKPNDRWEVNDVRQHNLELADHLEKTLRTFVDASRQRRPLAYPVLESGLEFRF